MQVLSNYRNTRKTINDHTKVHPDSTLSPTKLIKINDQKSLLS